MKLASIGLIDWFPNHLLSILNFLLTLVFVSFILRAKRPPGGTWAWLFFVAIIPYIGIPFYLFFSGRKFQTKLQTKEALFQPKGGENTKSLDPVERILETLGNPSAKYNNEGNFISSGELAYAELNKLVGSAKKSINLTTFIFADDEVGDAILTLLIKKLREGVAVRILLDSLGSLWVKHPSFKEFAGAGGQIGYFMPLLHIPFKGRSNLRIHRKTLIVDGTRAILGGMNIAKEYMGSTEDTKRWVDLGLEIYGPSVKDLESVFKKDWKFATGKNADTDITESFEPAAENRLQIVASGPDVLGDPLYDSLLTLIFKANKRIWISTPYFIPDESLAKGLQLAAQRGVDVCILIPQKSNHFLADLARGSYVRQLTLSGCKFRFLPKMIHAKAFLVDSENAVIGSANFDMRSLLYNYEIGAFMSSKNNILSLEKWFISRFAETNSKILPSGFWIDMAEGVGRVLGPMI
jgi:cardiolipin synthase